MDLVDEAFGLAHAGVNAHDAAIAGARQLKRTSRGTSAAHFTGATQRSRPTVNFVRNRLIAGRSSIARSCTAWRSPDAQRGAPSECEASLAST